MQYVIITLILFALELIYFKIADRFNIIDKPNERSSHTQITLRGGGVIFYIGCLIYFLWSGFQYPFFFLGITLITIISFLDDILTLSNKIRLAIHIISVLLLFYQINLFDFPMYITAIALIVTIGTINAYNFMDGINGITAAYSVAVLGLLAITNHYIHFIDDLLLYVSILATVVFGFFNFRNKAKCFAGDVGSVSMAFLVVFLIAKLIVTTQNPIFILYLLIYGLDTVWTILRRLSKKENIFKAHRSHLYQFMANEAKINKLLVSSSYGIIQFALGLIVLYVALEDQLTNQIRCAVGLIVVCSIVYLVIKQKIIKKYNL